MTKDPKTIELGNDKILSIIPTGNKYICKLFRRANKELVPLKGSNNQLSLTITGVIDSPHNFQRIVLWIGDDSAIKLFLGLANKTE